jgi:hypothetical protein
MFNLKSTRSRRLALAVLAVSAAGVYVMHSDSEESAPRGSQSGSRLEPTPQPLTEERIASSFGGLASDDARSGVPSIGARVDAPSAAGAPAFDPGAGEAIEVDDEDQEEGETDWDAQELAEQASVGEPHDERTPLDYRALGYTSEAAMLEDVRDRLDIPADHAISVYRHDVDGQPMVAVAVAAPDE